MRGAEGLKIFGTMKEMCNVMSLSLAVKRES